MLLSIRKIFSNLKLALLLLLIGLAILFIELYHLTQYSDRLSALKNQHQLIAKILTTDTSDAKMAAILVNGALAELDLAVKHSGEESFPDSIVASGDEQASLLRSLSISSKNFQNSATLWISSPAPFRASMQDKMMLARAAYLADINQMSDYQIHMLVQAVATAEITAVILFIFGFATYFLYRFRLSQIYRDIDHACAVDIDGSKVHVYTREIDFIFKRLARKTPQNVISPVLQHPVSGLNNEKGMITAFNAKKAGRAGNTLFLSIFEIDQFELLNSTLSRDDFSAMYKKLADIFLMYEQPFDVIGQMDNDQIIFLLSRNSKESALSECEKIVRSVEESAFNTVLGPIKITLSCGFLLKSPAKTLEDVIEEGRKLIEKAKENGGNRVAELRGRADSYHR